MLDDWYNTSTNASDVNPFTGVPYGFQHVPMPGMADGYPLLFSGYLSEARASDLLTYARDGGYLNSQVTDYLNLRLVSYNPEAVVFGFFSATLQWLDSGEIEMTFNNQALPAVEYSSTASNWRPTQMVPDLLLLVLVAFYLAMTLFDTYNTWSVERKSHLRIAPSAAAAAAAADASLEPRRSESGSEVSDDDNNGGGANRSAAAEERRKKKAQRARFRSRTSLRSLVFELTLCGLMLAAVAVWYVYATSIVQDDVFLTRYDVYDGDASAPCRYLLLRRTDPANSSSAAANGAASALNGTATAANATSGTAGVPLPGAAGRWRLPEDGAGMYQLGQMMSRVQAMYVYHIVYKLLQVRGAGYGADPFLP